jgi:tetratricopeptide (TPR) repeat protein
VERHGEALEPAARARLESIKGVAAVANSDLPAGLRAFQEATASYEALGDARARAEMLANQGSVLLDLGRFEEADVQLSTALAEADRMQLLFVSAGALMNLCQLRGYQGRFAEAAEAGQRATELGRQQGDVRIEAFAELYLSVSAFLEGRFEEAEARASHSARLIEAVRVPLLPTALAAMAQALLGQARTAEALRHAREAHRLLQAGDSVYDGEALVRLTYAQCLVATGDSAGARPVVHTAVRRIHERAAGIPDRAGRQLFLSRLPFHARTLEMSP